MSRDVQTRGEPRKRKRRPQPGVSDTRPSSTYRDKLIAKKAAHGRGTHSRR